MHLVKVLKAMMFTPARQRGVVGDVTAWGLPVIVEGEPGTAKSAIIEDLAAQYGLPCEVLSPGERGEAAFGAVPVPIKDKDGVTRIHYPTPEWEYPMNEATGGVVFVDEANTGGPALQPPLMGLIHARRIGGKQLNRRVRVLAAINPPEIAANGFDLAPPIANRFGWFKWENPSAEDHRSYMLGTASTHSAVVMPAIEEEERVMDLWSQAFSEARGLETAFIMAASDWKNKCPKVNDPAAARAWPSDRSWENATRAFAAGRIHDLDASSSEETIAAFVGAKAAQAFFTFIEQADLPNIADLLDDKLSFKFEKSRLDKMAATVNAGAAFVGNPQCAKRADRAAKFWEILLKCCEGGASDIVLPANETLIMAGLAKGKMAVEVMAKVNAPLNAVNSVGKR